MAAAAPEQPLNGTKTTISSLLYSLTTCLSSAGSSLPLTTKNAPSDVTIEPPTDGISLLDTKSDLLLSYLHNLVFLILFQLRGISDAASSKPSSNGVDNNDEKTHSSSLSEDVVKKLVELRVYLDRGVRPLESRLKYQIDKVVKAAEDAERSQRAGSSAKSKTKKTKKKMKAQTSDHSEDEDVEDGVSDPARDECSNDEEVDSEEEEIDEMAYRPNISVFARGLQGKSDDRQKPSTTKDKKSTPSDGIYRPPRIKPTALPTTDSNRKDREARRLKKSSVIDEFVTAEMSSAPMAEPSIGSTIQRGGRKVISQQERNREMERRNYEETNYVRLPKESKKERAKREGGRQGGFGGEEFRLLREGADRIDRLTRRAAGSSRGSALDKSRKRKLTADGPRDDGVGIGQVFEKRRKKIDSWKK